MVSVIVPTFNRKKTIIRAINSILNQTYIDVEIIVVDDCSTDDTQKVVNSLNSNKIKYVKHDKNRGACAARNTGIKLAKGEYIAFLDSDDEWLPEKLEKQINFLKSNDADIVFCSHISYHDNKKIIFPNHKIYNNDLFKKLLYGNFITTGSILGKAECFHKVNFDLRLPRLQDWDLMINMVQNFSIQHLNEILTVNYVQKDSITKDNKKGLEAIKIIYSKLQNSSYMSNKLKANFFAQMGGFAVKANMPASQYFKQSLSNKISFKTFIKYIVCRLGVQNLFFKK